MAPNAEVTWSGSLYCLNHEIPVRACYHPALEMMKNFLLYCSRQEWMKSAVLKIPLAPRLARRFMAGETLDDALQVVREVNALGLTGTIDHLGEHVTDPAEARRAVEIYLDALQRIVDEKLDANVSMKLSELGQDIDDCIALENARIILEKAKHLDVFVRVDMEGSAYTQRTLDAYLNLKSTFENVGIVLQSYLHRTRKDIPFLVGQGIRIRLCKGAYDEPSTIAYESKTDTDQAYKDEVTMLLESGLYHGIATHDPVMVDWTLAEMKRLNLEPSAFEFQMLYGVRRDLQTSLREQGYNVRIYVPFGENWYPYFTRRMAERPANFFFILKNIIKG